MIAQHKALGAVLLAIAAIPQAKAQYAPTFPSTSCWSCRDHDDWWERRHRRHHHTRKVWRQAPVDDRCKAALAVVGDQYASENGAKQEADKAWMQTARWQHGERYMDREHASNAAYECGRSSVGSVAGQVFHRCRLTARPCRAAGERGRD